MGFYETLTRQLLTIIDTKFDPEIECQPTRHLHQAELFQLEPRQLVPAMRALLQDDQMILSGNSAMHR